MFFGLCGRTGCSDQQRGDPPQVRLSERHPGGGQRGHGHQSQRRSQAEPGKTG